MLAGPGCTHPITQYSLHKYALRAKCTVFVLEQVGKRVTKIEFKIFEIRNPK